MKKILGVLLLFLSSFVLVLNVNANVVEEVPATLDNIINFVVMCVVSITLIVAVIVIIKKRK